MANLARTAWIAAASVAGASGAALATTYCVTCDGPAAQYACSVDAPAQSSLQIYCISELAKSGKHASCSVNRDQQGNCAGIAKTLAAPDELAIGAPTPEAPPKAEVEQKTKAVEQPHDGDKSATKDDPAKPVEATATAAKETGSALEKAGDAVAGAAKKTWSCVTSLFSDC